ncbi:MAG: hypothetical protein KAX49_01450 [Halanaerobiales bacterium]|nr:hypothetical protein [Halanaerobiales bacterium]
MKIRKLVPILFLIVLFLTGCNLIPNLKDFDEVTPPTWDVAVQIPLIKAWGNLGDAVADADLPDGLIVNEDTNIYTFTFSTGDDPDLDLKVPLPELTVDSSALSFDAFNWSQGAISINAGIADINLNNSINDDQDNLMPPTDITFDYFTKQGIYIQAPFERAKLSNAPTNKVDFSLDTDEPFDKIIITLKDKEGNQVGTNTIEFVNLGDPDKVSMDHQHLTGSILLAESDIPKEMNFEVILTAHSTQANIDLTLHISDQLEIVEVEGFNFDDLDFSEINFSSIKPLGALIGINEVTIESGKIYLNENTVMADKSTDNNKLPFRIQEFYLGNIKLMKNDENRRYIDLSGVTLSPESEITVDIQFEDTFIYDVWDDVNNEIKPYEYNLGFSMTDIKAKSISGDISDLIPDPYPDTPDWDFQLEEIGTGIVEIPIPEEYQDVSIGLKDIFLNLNIDNQTSFVGNLTMSLKTFEDAEGLVPLKDENDENMEANFSLNLEARNELDFSLGEEEDYQKFIDIINSKPAYVSFGISGGLSLSKDFYITSDDYILPSGSVELPLALTIPSDGLEISDVISEEITLEVDQRDLIDQVSEFIEEVSLHIKYTNDTSFGLGARFTFSTPEGTLIPIETILHPSREDEVVFKIDTALTDVLANETGFEVTVDIIIPNESDTDHVVNLQPTDSIKCTIWIDGKINVHVPENL